MCGNRADLRTPGSPLQVQAGHSPLQKVVSKNQILWGYMSLLWVGQFILAQVFV